MSTDAHARRPDVTPQLREVLRLRVQLDMTYVEIADEMGTTEEQARRLLRVALAWVRRGP